MILPHSMPKIIMAILLLITVRIMCEFCLIAPQLQSVAIKNTNTPAQINSSALNQNWSPFAFQHWEITKISFSIVYTICINLYLLNVHIADIQSKWYSWLPSLYYQLAKNQSYNISWKSICSYLIYLPRKIHWKRQLNIEHKLAKDSPFLLYFYCIYIHY